MSWSQYHIAQIQSWKAEVIFLLNITLTRIEFRKASKIICVTFPPKPLTPGLTFADESFLFFFLWIRRVLHTLEARQIESNWTCEYRKLSFFFYDSLIHNKHVLTFHPTNFRIISEMIDNI